MKEILICICFFPALLTKKYERKRLSNSDGFEYLTSEYEYPKKLRVRVRALILKNVLEYENRKKVRVQERTLLQV